MKCVNLHPPKGRHLHPVLPDVSADLEARKRLALLQARPSPPAAGREWLLNPFEVEQRLLLEAYTTWVGLIGGVPEPP